MTEKYISLDSIVMTELAFISVFQKRIILMVILRLTHPWDRNDVSTDATIQIPTAAVLSPGQIQPDAKSDWEQQGVISQVISLSTTAMATLVLLM